MSSSMIMGMLGCFAAVINPGTQQTTVKDLSLYLPEQECINEWKPAYVPQTFTGENLYDLINGGASIYYEYGFNQVITQQYVNADSQYITLELYDMKNSAAAYGMYTYKTGTSGETVDIGAGALLEDYYLNFWKGKFLGTVTGFGSGQENEEALLMIARLVAEKIADISPAPLLVDLLPQDSLLQTHIAYVKGSLGLSKFHMFDNIDIFDIKEAAVGNYKDYQIIVFMYDDVKQCIDVFQHIQDYFSNHAEYSDFAAFEGAFSLRDNNEQHIHFTLYERYLFVYIGTGEQNTAKLFEIIRNNIK